MSLDDIAKYLGIDQRKGGGTGLDGSKVYDAWRNQRFSDIETYCISDVELLREVHHKIKRVDAETYIYIDIETVPAQGLAPHEITAIVEKKVPKNYSKPESIRKWITDNRENVYHRTGLDPMLGRLLCIGVAVEHKGEDQ